MTKIQVQKNASPMNDKDDGYTTAIFEATKINDCKILDFLLIKLNKDLLHRGLQV